MSYNYHMFVHPVPCGTTIPEGTQVRWMDLSSHFTETFFTTVGDYKVPNSHSKTYYLDYDITKPQVPTDPLSVIYNVTVRGRQEMFPVGLLTVHGAWTLVDKMGDSYYCDAKEIESFVTPHEEEEDES